MLLRWLMAPLPEAARPAQHAAVLAAILGLFLVVAACNSRSTPPTPTPSPPQQPSVTPPPATDSASPTASSFSWPTYHGDAARTGVVPGPAWTGVQPAWSSDQLDGDVYAQPLVDRGRIIVATENDSIYALDAASGKVLWQTRLGDPMSGSSLPCGDIDPSGITGTPVIDPARGLVYAVAFVQPGRHLLAALDLSNGTVRFQRPIDPPGADPLVEQQRAALALADGRVYVAFGGLFGDCGSYRGWVVASNADGSGDLLSYPVDASKGAGIWAPGGPSIDPSGNLYVATGNSNARGSTPDDGDSVLELSPDLRRLDSFTPSDWAAHNARDQDLGSMSPVLLDNGLVLQAGKPGVGYLLGTSSLGGVGGQVASTSVCSGAYGGSAYEAGVVYVACRDGVAAVRVDASAPALSVAWHGPRFNAGPPIIAGGLVWTVDLGSGDLYGLDPATRSVRVRESTGRVMHFTTPAADPGHIYVAADRRIMAFAGQ